MNMDLDCESRCRVQFFQNWTFHSDIYFTLTSVSFFFLILSKDYFPQLFLPDIVKLLLTPSILLLA